MAKLNRDEILRAIQDCVLENEAVPGRRQFVAEYDVPSSAFQGMYWPNWSAAVRDAGFEPQPPNGPLDESIVLSAVASLVRDLGRMPSHAEVRFQKQDDPSFPSRAVFVRVLGSTAPERAQRLRDWCALSSEWADVIDLLPAPDIDDEAADTASAGQGDGFVYLMRSGRLHKIGMSGSVPRRWAEIAGASPAEVELVHYFRTDDPSGVEAYWHRRFADRREGGEWFRLRGADVLAFKRRKRFM